MPIPRKPDAFSLIAGTQRAQLRISAPDANTASYQYQLNGGEWVSVTLTDRTQDVTTTITSLSAGTDYNINVRSLNNDGQSEALSTAFRTTDTATGQVSPIASNVYIVCNAEASASVDINQASSDATHIKPAFGIRKWQTFDGSILSIENAPITDRLTELYTIFIATNQHGSTRLKVSIKILPSRKALLDKPLFLVHRGGRVFENGETNSPISITTTGTPDLVAVISKNVTRYSLESVISDREISEAVTPSGGGTRKSTTFGGLQYDLVALDAGAISDSVNLSFHGRHATIHEVHFLQLGYQLNHLDRGVIQVKPGQVDRTGDIHEETDGGLERYPGTGGGKWKYTVFYEVAFEHSDEHETFLHWAENNLNFFHIEGYNRRPHRMYHATWGTTEYNNEYISRFRELGTKLQFRAEQR